MRKSIILLAGLILAATTACGQSLTGPGARYTYQFETPAGWKAAPQEAFEMKLNFVLRPENNSDRADTSIIVTRSPRPGGSDPLAEFIKRDINNMKQETLKLEIKRTRLTFENLAADKVVQGRYQVYEFSVPKTEPKAVAVYIDIDESVCMLVFAATTENLYKRYWDNYLALVKSFRVTPMY